MKLSPLRLLPLIFNKQSHVRSGLIVATAIAAIGMPQALKIGDEPSSEQNDPAAAAVQMEVLKGQLSALKDSEKTLRLSLQTENKPTEEQIETISKAHVAFMKSLVFSRDISEAEYGAIRTDYLKNFGETYGYEYTYKSENRDVVAKTTLGDIDDVASFKQCQHEHMTRENLVNPDQMFVSMQDCLSSSNSTNVLGGIAVFGVIGFALLNAFNTRTLREVGQGIRNDFAEKDRLSAQRAQEKAQRKVQEKEREAAAAQAKIAEQQRLAEQKTVAALQDKMRL